MSRRPTDISGKQFANLKVLSPTHEVNRSGQKLWNFECVCGKQVILPAADVIRGNNTSCGCVRRARNRAVARRDFQLRAFRKGIVE